MPEKHHNATWLFERETSGANFPHSSESFWSAIFALFLVHLGTRLEPEKRSIQLYQLKDAAGSAFRRVDKIQIGQLAFDDVAVEPSRLDGKHFGVDVNLSIEEGGFRPDLLVRLHHASVTLPTHMLIENKTIRYAFKEHQALNYERLIESLGRQNVRARVLLLTSASSDAITFRTAEALQSKLNERFGLLLWEDVIRQMQSTGFAVPGVNISEWQRYTGTLDAVVEQAKAKAPGASGA